MRQALNPGTAANVRAELARAGITGTTAADRLGMSKATMARSLRGERPFTVDELAALAALLDLPVASLISEPAPAAVSS